MILLVTCLAGSKLYGLDTPTSDTDYSSIAIPTLDQLMLGDYPKLTNAGTSNDSRKNTADDHDHLVYSLAYFVQQACNGKQQAIDLLHAPDSATLESSAIWKDLQHNRKAFYSRSMSSSVDFIAKQIALHDDRLRSEQCLTALEEWAFTFQADGSEKIYTVADKLPVNEYLYFVVTTEGGFKEVLWQDVCKEKRGVFYSVDGSLIEVSLTLIQLCATLDQKFSSRSHFKAMLIRSNGEKEINWSEVSHAMRVGYQVLSILTKGDFEYPLPETDFLRRIKSGELDFTRDVKPQAKTLIADIQRLMLVSDLPETVDVEYWKQWLIHTYRKYYNIFPKLL